MKARLCLIFCVCSLVFTLVKSQPIFARALENFYAEQGVNEVRIYSPHWDQLRQQEPQGGICNFEYIGSRYDWFQADSVIVNGVSFDQAGMKKRSWCGSESKDKPSLAIKLDKYNDGNKKRAIEALGTEYLTLNNSRQDASYVRQCLSYLFFRAAGLAAPLCNYTKLWVNDQYYGVYVNVQSYRKSFFEKSYGKPAGKLFELEGSDFHWWAVDKLVASVDDFSDNADTSIINSLISSFDQADQGNWDGLLSKINEDEFLKFWALEELLVHWDGMTRSNNNSYMYQSGDGQLHFLPWGTDQILNRPGDEAHGDFVNNRLARKLYESAWFRDSMHNYLRSYRDNLWNEGNIYRYIDDTAGRIQGAIPPHESDGFWHEVGSLKWFVSERRQQIQSFLP